MTRAELSTLYALRSASERVMLAKDMFCLQAALGCRVSDFLRLTHLHIQNGRLCYYPHKKSEMPVRVEVPLSGRAREIVERYRTVSEKGLLMPFMSVQTYNRYIREAFREAGLDRTVTKYDRDLKKELHFKLYETASSHLARRTFTDVLCQAGEPLHVVASMSGHSEHSRAFDRYRSRPARLQQEAVGRSMD
jgi:integrase